MIVAVEWVESARRAGFAGDTHHRRPARMRAVMGFAKRSTHPAEVFIRRAHRRALQHALAGVRAVAALARLQHQNDDQRREDHQERDAAGDGAECIDVGLGDRGGQALQLERQGVDRTDRLAGARQFSW